MREPEDVSAMLRLHELGWGTKRIAAELGVSRNTVRRYLRQGGGRGTAGIGGRGGSIRPGRRSGLSATGATPRWAAVIGVGRQLGQTCRRRAESVPWVPSCPLRSFLNLANVLSKLRRVKENPWACRVASTAA